MSNNAFKRILEHALFFPVKTKLCGWYIHVKTIHFQDCIVVKKSESFGVIIHYILI